MTDLFEHHMNAMKVHYNSNPSHTYALPVNLMPDTLASPSLGAFAAADAGATAVDSAISNYKQSLQDTVDDVQNAASSGVQTLQDSKGDQAATNSFVQMMQAEKEKQIQAAKDRINQNFDDLIAVGQRHPKQQKHILTATQKIGAFFTNLLAKIGEFFENLVNSIKDFFIKVGKWFEHAFNTVKDWAEDTAGKIKDFFESIF